MAKKKLPPPSLRDDLNALDMEILSQTNRGAVLILSAYLDDALAHLLKSRLVEDEEIVDVKLFGFDRPLGSFSSRINMAYAMGLIDKLMLVDLNIIRDIRNSFAHFRGPLSFTDQSISAQAKNLKWYANQLAEDKYEDIIWLVSNPFRYFDLTCTALIIHILALAEIGEHAKWDQEEDAKAVTASLPPVVDTMRAAKGLLEKERAEIIDLVKKKFEGEEQTEAVEWVKKQLEQENPTMEALEVAITKLEGVGEKQRVEALEALKKLLTALREGRLPP